MHANLQRSGDSFDSQVAKNPGVQTGVVAFSMFLNDCNVCVIIAITFQHLHREEEQATQEIPSTNVSRTTRHIQ